MLKFPMVLKEIKDPNKWRHTVFLDSVTQDSKNVDAPQTDLYSVNEIPIEISAKFLWA